ncbi:MAG: sigma-54-dependent Fis family transcriptional regulator [Bryobacterales bacterium]|nr:sigma-54-dependent Fis family transcriptional regulator [Bryobacterales bacterium]
MITLLAIDDDPRSLALTAATVEQEGLEVLTCEDPEQALCIVRQRLPRIVICDLVMPKLSGLEVLRLVSAIDPSIEVILLTAHYSAETAVEAIRNGAYDYLTKPVDPDRLRARVDELVAEGRRRQRAGRLDDELVETHQFHGMIGRSPGMIDVFARIRRIAPHYQTVLITGATGTGKELVARALHNLSPAAQGHFVVCNCAALPEALIESELFGYARGAFTGATLDKPGLFEHANNGTLLLDEIGEMPPAAQAKVLRVIQHHELQRVGSPIPKKINVRVIAATHRDLRRMVAEQRFREDLLYRLTMVELQLPPLSARREDLPLLIRHFVSLFSRQYQKKLSGLTTRAETVLLNHPWPGNVRELENAIGSAAMMAERPLIDVGDLPGQFQGQTAAAAESHQPEEVLISLDEAQRRHALRVIRELAGDKAAAARVLGVSRATLYRIVGRKPGQ